MSTIARRAADYDGHRVTVSADDGVPISVRTFGADDAPLTVVFVHGHCLRTESWTFLREELTRQWGDSVRMVFYDHRGHGESGVADPSTYTIDQLGHDLDAVLRTIAPTGPVVLVGHSMGAMVILAYARLFPEAIGTKVLGVGLIAGIANGLNEVGIGRLLHRYAVTSLQAAVVRAPRVMQASKQFSRRIFEPIMREASFGTRKINPRMIAVATAMLNETPLLTMSSFLGSLITFDETASLHRLGDIPALVLAGSADIVVPFAHSVLLASQLSSAELVRIEGAGHSVILERAEEVALSIVALVNRASGTMTTPGPEYAAAS
ncbi:Pimeloyl-ACP methyl ester carboxylesterase [Nocardia amikacinitolerans]|uniref:Pimeloyl-ACP methyl ester carboxylesterase n=1 Tax=Nocardia amikacinitolerans TaxID=756689 RepID=A0A285LVM2_9NOCA|nr:alpha/beta hydrolase [Nocardia amikacinitolerans]MCP2276649.1 Pimeloyl-ACP methyl ester carboxylesterase [Nocardia amikacinitolerans]MCP2294970.1 Pimeloyl-ACP methyl ester carboxylesterase [Nocardia amikacinitolerans]SNY87401.1 Pimeloyl-ACP methyl ester carboxylesterase [Nocardia amikacinitolerans]